ncbi:hypothetical protein ACFOSC_04410 [Streptantibioticus rubrisoli]|uniref:Uncharacterized protein n=1 Tax=Streptantibioticus rubrisoli TaxID=1387313 RepID=A0ABT1PMT5_9ACTN|nr:hypothetical protein [Streptantibioticus rubrisoli]MCQ4046670.1 hypothetical protein [Streptantibioticus rubrisoli]
MQKYEPLPRIRYIRPTIGSPANDWLGADGWVLDEGAGLGVGLLVGLGEAGGVLAGADGVGLVATGGGLLLAVLLSVGMGEEDGRSIVLNSRAALRIRLAAFRAPCGAVFPLCGTGFLALSGNGSGLASAIRVAVQNFLASSAVQWRDSGSGGGASSGIAWADMDWSSVNSAVTAEALGHRNAPANSVAPETAAITARRLARLTRRLARPEETLRTLVVPPRGNRIYHGDLT